jgi:hypothetical protein
VPRTDQQKVHAIGSGSEATGSRAWLGNSAQLPSVSDTAAQWFSNRFEKPLVSRGHGGRNRNQKERGLAN